MKLHVCEKIGPIEFVTVVVCFEDRFNTSDVEKSKVNYPPGLPTFVDNCATTIASIYSV